MQIKSTFNNGTRIGEDRDTGFTEKLELWICPIDECANSSDACFCRVCHRPRPLKSAPDTPDPKKSPPEDNWICPRCETSNSGTFLRCRVCGFDKSTDKHLPPPPKTWNCPVCGNPNSETVSICSHCNTPRDAILWSCKHCNHLNVETAEYCVNCGKRRTNKNTIVWIAAAIIALIVIIAAISSSGDSSSSAVSYNGSSKNTTANTSASLQKTDGERRLESAQGYINSGKYQDAVITIRECMSLYPDTASKCKNLYRTIASKLKKYAPETGETLRTINYQGGNELYITASSGPMQLVVTDINNPSTQVFAFVQEDETLMMYLPGGKYQIDYTVDIYWFADGTEFLELCSSRHYPDTIDFKVNPNNFWICRVTL